MSAVKGPELGSIIEAAEQAATSGDFESAEQFLRQAARVQETQLGPLHPDLASTLNNLGVVCEKLNKPADAEECYRRAYAIVTSVLAADDPVVITSRENLRDFCEGHGRPFELSPPLPTAPPKIEPRRPARRRRARRARRHLNRLPPPKSLPRAPPASHRFPSLARRSLSPSASDSLS